MPRTESSPQPLEQFAWTIVDLKLDAPGIDFDRSVADEEDVARRATREAHVNDCAAAIGHHAVVGDGVEHSVFEHVQPTGRSHGYDRSIARPMASVFVTAPGKSGRRTGKSGQSTM